MAVLLALLGAMALPAASGAAVIPVNITADLDDTDGGGDAFCDTDLITPGLQCSLRAAVETADGQSGSDEVDLPFDVTLTIPTAMQVNSGDALTIKGTNPSARSVINADGTHSHLDVSEIDLTLQHVRLTNGFSSAAGSPGSISYTSFTNKLLKLDDVRVDGNASSPTAVGDIGSGGAIFAFGQGQILEIINSTIDGNSAGNLTHAGQGGAIFLEGAGPSATITGSTITENHAFGGTGITRGGAILAQNNSGTPPNGTLTLTNTTVESNVVGGAGATGFSNGGGIALTGFGNAVGLTVTGGSLSGNEAGGGPGNAQGLGGAVDSLGGDPIVLTNVSVGGNRAGGEDGMGPGTGTGFGGGIHTTSALSVSGSSFTTNTAGVTSTGEANGTGGAILAEGTGSTASITNSNFVANAAGSGVGDNGTGAGISATNGGTFTLTGSTLTNNTANGEGGGLYRFRDATSGGDDTVTGTRFAGNQATYAGGAMSLYTNLFFGINSDDISGNSIGAQGPGGGGIFAEDATAGATSGAVSIANTTITGNNATAAPLTQDGGGLLAGTIRPLDLDISYSTISQNNASDQGGNLAFKGNTTVHPTLSFVSSIVSGGTATNTPASSNCFFTSAPNGVNVASTGGNVEDTTPSQCAFLAPPMGSDVVGANPLLGSLANNGGPTKTLALQTGSPAIGLGASPCPPTDQRGYPRPGLGGSSCDSGAYELSVCNGAAVTDPTPPTGCPSPPSDGGSTPPPPATSTSPPPAGAPAKKKCKKRKRRAAAAKKCKRRKTS